MIDYYNDLDLRVYGENLKTLQINYENTKNIDETNNRTVALYNATNNTIKINKNFNMSDKQQLLILRHEAGHLFNNIIYENASEDYSVKYYFNYNFHGKYVKEGLDVLFTTKPFMDEYQDLYFEDKGYAIITNIIEVLTESTNYDFNNYVSENIYGFESYLNKNTGNSISSNYIFDIVDLLWLDSSSENFELNESYYKEVYYYVASAYINQYKNQNLTNDEIQNIEANLILKLSKGVIDTSLIQVDSIVAAVNDNLKVNENTIIR